MSNKHPIWIFKWISGFNYKGLIFRTEKLLLHNYCVQLLINFQELSLKEI